MTVGIYQITNSISNKIYIGSSYKLEKRWLYHRADLRRHRHHNPHLQNAWNKYGENAFQFEVLEYCQPEDLITIEQYYLDWLEPFGDRGYNIARKAEAPGLGHKHTLETRAKIGAKAKGRPSHNKGKPMSEEQKQKISKANTGKKHTDETRKKLSIINKGRTPWIKGRHHTEETKLKLSQLNKGNIGEKSPNAILTWQQVKEIRSMYHKLSNDELAEQYHISKRCIKHIIYHTTWHDPNYTFIPRKHTKK